MSQLIDGKILIPFLLLYFWYTDKESVLAHFGCYKELTKWLVYVSLCSINSRNLFLTAKIKVPVQSCKSPYPGSPTAVIFTVSSHWGWKGQGSSLSGVPLVCSVAQSCPTLWTWACQASLTMRFFRQKYWSRLPFPPPGDLPDQGSNPDILYHWATWKARVTGILLTWLLTV